MINNSEILSGIFTAILLAVFVSIVLWAWSARRKPAFDAAARRPLEEDGDFASSNHESRSTPQ